LRDCIHTLPDSRRRNHPPHHPASSNLDTSLCALGGPGLRSRQRVPRLDYPASSSDQSGKRRSRLIRTRWCVTVCCKALRRQSSCNTPTQGSKPADPRILRRRGHWAGLGWGSNGNLTATRFRLPHGFLALGADDVGKLLVSKLSRLLTKFAPDIRPFVRRVKLSKAG